jgi:hypothetical protein
MKTVNALLLLGWMEKDEAILYLQEQCWFDPPLTNQQAEELWVKYNQAVAALPERTVTRPDRLPVPKSRKEFIDNVRQRCKSDPEILDILNIDPTKLVVYQFYVVTDVADRHAQSMSSDRQWAKTCLQLDRPGAQLPVRSEDSIIKVNLPHPEHMFTLTPNDGAFRVQQGGGFVCVCEIEGRLLLKAGYHRSFAFARAARNEPDAKERSLFVALTKTPPPQLSTDFPTLGLRTIVLGPRPPLFSDFFNDDLAMTVKLRKRRYEMHIKVDIVPFDDQS